MSQRVGIITICFALAATVASAQTKLAFDVATVKPAAPLDMMKMAAAVRAGQAPKIGPHVDSARAEYTYMAMKDLIALAYDMKPYQVTGPDWMANQRFDIVAKLPDGSSKGDASKMLQTLLADRFKLTVHHDSTERPVLALVVGKGGPKLKESPEEPKAIAEDAPLKAGETQMDTPDGPMRMTVGKDGSALINMGLKGTVAYRMDPATQTMHMDGNMMTMSGLADMLTRFSQVGGAGRQILDMTGLKGHYQVAMEFSLADLLNMARAAGVELPAGAGAPPGVGGASDPGGLSLVEAVQAMGLKMEPRKAMVDQLVVEHVEKTPTEN